LDLSRPMQLVPDPSARSASPRSSSRERGASATRDAWRLAPGRPVTAVELRRLRFLTEYETLDMQGKAPS
jgi:hypothetical protein